MRVNTLSLIIALTACVSLTVGVNFITPAQAENTPTKPQQNLPLDDLRNFAEVMGRIKTSYVEEVSDKKLLEGAIRGMLENLDPHSAYLDAKELDELQSNTSGEFGGLGIEVGMEDGFVKVVTPLDDTPAYRAGLKSGDLIIKLDETNVKGLTLSEAVDKMRGKPGTPITLTVVREGLNKPFIVKITREVIRVQSVKSRLLDPGYGYIRISQFQEGTAKDLRKAIEQLDDKNKAPLKGLVLDLRNNPGGLLQSAIDVSDAFLSDGLIVYTKGRIGNSENYSATKSSDDLSVPMIVLINSGSASASEIVAGALQDHHRAIIMGIDSFGKGSVQTIIPLNNDSALKLTTALYYTPNGRSIQAQGIVPDIKVDPAKLKENSDDDLLNTKEADLSGHLKNGNGGPDKPSKPNSVDQFAPKADKSSASDKDNKEKQKIDEDYQLNEALNLLKAMNIISSKQDKQNASNK